MPPDLLAATMLAHQCQYYIQIIGVTGVIGDIGTKEMASARKALTRMNIDAFTWANPPSEFPEATRQLQTS
jgi:hypothetical protein